MKFKDVLSDIEIKYVIDGLSFFPYRDVSHLIMKISNGDELSDIEISDVIEKLTYLPYRDVKTIIDKIFSVIKK